MSRHNNTSRSLIIISKQQGWDPNVIQGFEGDKGYDVGEVYSPRETPYQMNTTDMNGLPGCVKDPNADFGNWKSEEGQAVSRDRKSDATKNADPYPGMPGAKG